MSCSVEFTLFYVIFLCMGKEISNRGGLHDFLRFIRNTTFDQIQINYLMKSQNVLIGTLI